MGRPVANRDNAVELKYNPYQVAFLNALTTKTAGGKWGFNRLSLFAGRRGGKTRIGGLAAVQKMQALPNSTGWVCAPTYPDLHDFVMPSVFQCLPEAWIADWSAQYFTLRLKNGATCAFRSLDDPERARGPGLDWAWIDEARKVSELAWDTMLPALTDKAGQVWVTTSPNGFDWCYKRFWFPAQLGDRGFWACKYKTSENPAIDAEELAAARKQLNPLWYAQEFEADFVTFAGAIYGAAMEPAILRTVDQIRAVLPEWPDIDPTRVSIVGLDPGADHPFAGLVLVSTSKGLVAVGEHLARNKAAHEHVRDLNLLLSKRSHRTPLRPAQWAIDRSQKQWAIELAQHGIFVQAAENNVVAGIQRVHSWLAARQLWFIEDCCPRTVEQMRNYRWAENNNPDGQLKKETVIKLDDDLPDALRYALMLWPELPEIDVQADSRRALAALPEDVRWAVERMRRVDARDGDERSGLADDLEPSADADGVTHTLGDFYGSR